MAPRLLPSLLLGAALLLPAAPAFATLERAQAAQARGDLRGAQLELRNAVRNRPNDPALRAALAEASLDVGDGDTAEKEARAALERGYDQVAGTRMLLLAYLTLNRARDLLRDFPAREQPPALGGQIAAARALAQLSLEDRAAARQSVADAVRLAPGAAEPHLAAAVLALVEGDAAEGEAAIDRALAADPGNPQARLRKATVQFGRGEAAAAAETLAPVVARAPGNVPARLLRAEAFLRLGRDADAKTEVDAALRTQGNSAPALYLRAVLLSRAQDWRAADEVFTRLGSVLANFPDGFLFAALTKRAIGQNAQAEDLAGRYVARRPEDPRGAKLLASLELEGGRPDAAAGTLNRLAERGAADAEAFNMLGRAHFSAGRPREAVTALERAAALAPGDAAIMSRLAAARLAAGDVAGTAQAARGSLEAAPDQAGAREMLAASALARGDIMAAEAELARLGPAASRSEAGAVLAGMVRLARLDLAGARTAFEGALRDFPNSVAARLGLVRVATSEGDGATAERLLGEILSRDAGNAEALARLVAMSAPGSPRVASARGVLEAAQSAAPAAPGPAHALAAVMARAGDTDGAIRLLDREPLKRIGIGPALPLLRAQLLASQQRWPDAEAATRAALAEDPGNIPARQLLAQLQVRAGDPQGAERTIREGLRAAPADPTLLGMLVGITRETRDLDAALALADNLAGQTSAQPTSRLLRGDLLLSQGRAADAAAAFAAAYAEAPSAVLAMRQALAWNTARQPERAAAALNDWLRRDPDNTEVSDVLAQMDLAAGRFPEAQRRFEAVLARQPGNALALNNLAWLLGEQAETRARGRDLAERAFFLLPNAETADTLGWILARQGEAARAVPLLRQAAVTTLASQTPNRGILYRLAASLNMVGQREEASRLLESLLANAAPFPERAEAERLLAELRAAR